MVIADGNGERIPVTASLGVATWHSSESVDSLVDKADRAMYASKTSGRNRVTAAAEPVVEFSLRPKARTSIAV